MTSGNPILTDLPITEFEFVLPRGLLDDEGTIHRQGAMRLATAGDELAMLKDRRVGDEPAYRSLILLARTIVRLGQFSAVTPELLENLFTQDLAYLREVYNRINQQGSLHVPTECPQCRYAYGIDLALAGES